MPNKTRALTGLVATALLAGTVSPAFAVSKALPRHPGPSVTASTPDSGQLVIDWNRFLIKLLGTSGLQPATVHPTRSFAILQAAEYDAVVSTTHRGEPYLFSVPAPRDSRPDAAADQAAHDVLAALYPAAATSIDEQLATELAAIPAGRAKNDATAVGATVAKLLVDVRSFDGSSSIPPAFTPGSQPGNYQPTAPKFTPVFTTWGSVTPFVLARGDQFRPVPPPAVSSAAYARALTEVKVLGQDSSTSRTTDQTTQAMFWGSAPIWNTWNEVTQTLLTDQHANLRRATTVFANLDLTLADATTALYDAKYVYQVWRPITAIQRENSGYNPGLAFDPNAPSWNPLAVTAADPSYVGAHSTISEAAATVLTTFFGSHQPVTVRSDNMSGVTRGFTDLQGAATEAGLSRIYAGQHTMIDHIAGQRLGSQVAEFVLRQLRPGHADVA